MMSLPARLLLLLVGVAPVAANSCRRSVRHRAMLVATRAAMRAHTIALQRTADAQALNSGTCVTFELGASLAEGFGDGVCDIVDNDGGDDDTLARDARGDVLRARANTIVDLSCDARLGGVATVRVPVATDVDCDDALCAAGVD
jgi:hypothetical protein